MELVYALGFGVDDFGDAVECCEGGGVDRVVAAAALEGFGEGDEGFVFGDGVVEVADGALCDHCVQYQQLVCEDGKRVRAYLVSLSRRVCAPILSRDPS